MRNEENKSMSINENDVNLSPEPAEKEILPRKRKIIKNNQLTVSVCIVCAAFMTWFVWRVMFNPLFDGAWHMKYNGSYIETYDTAEEGLDKDPSATSDIAEREIKFSQNLTYEFLDDGVCRVTLGSMSVEGTYDYGVTEQYGRVLSASVVYEYSPIFYGIYKIKTQGNIFTGRSMNLEEIPSEYETENNLLGTPENITLVRGKGELELEQIEDPEYDERLYGSWHDDGSNVTFEFTEDGHMIRSTSDGVSMDHIYTITEDNVIFAKYVVDREESYEIRYEFKNGTLYLNDTEMRKL